MEDDVQAHFEQFESSNTKMPKNRREDEKTNGTTAAKKKKSKIPEQTDKSWKNVIARVCSRRRVYLVCRQLSIAIYSRLSSSKDVDDVDDSSDIGSPYEFGYTLRA